MATGKTRMILFVMGLAATIAGLVVSIVFLFQPWRTCSYDDTASACAMLPGDAAIMGVALMVMMVGAGLLVASAFSRR
jgi:hypothetical protein